MSKPTYDPKQGRLFSEARRRNGEWVTAARFHCAVCNAMTVTTAGELCSKCRGPAKTSSSKGGRTR